MATILFFPLLHQPTVGKVLVIFQPVVAVSVKMVGQAAAVEQQQAQEPLAKVTMAAQLLATNQLAAAVEKVAQVQHPVETMAAMVAHHPVVLLQEAALITLAVAAVQALVHLAEQAAVQVQVMAA
jgi:hypothetical protein